LYISALNRTAESSYAWTRLGVALLLMTIGNAGMYTVVVALPALQAEFGVARSAASFPYTLTLAGFGLGGVLMGRLADKFGIMIPLLASAVALCAGYVAGGLSGNLLQFTLAQGLLIGLLGSSTTFAPLVADTSLWFTRRRGIAVAICISGNYVAGTVWPPVTQFLMDRYGWRATHIAIGIFCLIAMAPLALVLRPRSPATSTADAVVPARYGSPAAAGMSARSLQILLCIAGVACCVAMSMPQVHIVAYCTDLGIPAARGAEMLSLMMGFGIASRLISGWIADRIGGLKTVLIGSLMQMVALLVYLPSDTLMSLYVASALFGMFQGGIVSSYPIIVREFFPPQEAGTRVGAVLMATLSGMALGGWMSGAIFDLTGSYRAAFLNGIAFNLVNLSVIGWLLFRVGARRRAIAV
jgi:MFS family permease